MFKKFIIATAILAVLAAPALAQIPPVSGKAQIVMEQKADQGLASELMGADVIGDDNVKIGDVNDILFDREGRVVAYVVGVGGFLGIGAKDIALTPASFEIMLVGRWLESRKLKLSMTKDELMNAGEFKPYEKVTPTTGMGQR
jgi:sporulation protein YlmC with PRC-barrel domain